MSINVGKMNSLIQIHANIWKLHLHALGIAIACQQLTEQEKAENDLEIALAEQQQLPYDLGSVEAKEYIKGWFDRLKADKNQLSLIAEQTSSSAYKRGWEDCALKIEQGKQTSVPLWQPSPFLWEWL